MGYIKDLVDSTTLSSIPSYYTYNSTTSDNPIISDNQIPIIDFSLLTSPSPTQRYQAIQDLGKACSEWGFFMVINHGVPEKLIDEMIEACRGFFDMTEEEKLEYSGTHVLDPIRCGTSFNAKVDKVLFWRDFLKVFVHPDFHSPLKPPCFSDISLEFSRRTREVARELLNGISESLGLEKLYINKAMELENGLQILATNLYPICPQPELAMGMPPHSDHGLLTVLIQNEVGGLHVKHDDYWVHVNPIANSFLVNTGDHMEILSNGKYRSVIHRAVVNSKATRISIAVVQGPSLDTVVAPAPELVGGENNLSAYRGMKYKEYLELQQSNQLEGKSCLDRVRL